MIEEVFGKEQIAEKVKELGSQISKDYPDGVFVVCVLKGAFVFCADLIRSIDRPVNVNFISAQSYVGTETSGEVNLGYDIDVSGQDVLIVEDIIDTGLTLETIVEKMKSEGAKSVKICTLLDKPVKRKTDITPDYCGFEIPDYFVVGYGIDYKGLYRQLPYIGVIKPD